MWRAIQTAIIAVAFLTAWANSLPLAVANVSKKRIERRRISYSVVPVDGGSMDTSTSDIPMIVTVPGQPYAPPTATVTLTMTETVTPPAPGTTTIVVVEPTTVTPLETSHSSNIPAESPATFSNGSPCTTESSTSVNSLYPSPPPGHFPGIPAPSGLRPPSYAPPVSTAKTNTSFHSPTLTPQSIW